MMMQQKPVIIFDFGGVLLEWDPRQIFLKFFAGDEAAMERFLINVDFYAWNLELDRGTSFAQGVSELSMRFPQYAIQINAFDEHWEESIIGPIQPVVDVLYWLKAKGYSLHGLTNWSQEKFELVRHKYSFFKLFDSIVVSGEVHLVKPDPRIYALLLEQIKRQPEECVFVDDSQKNVAAAQVLGFKTIHFQSSDKFIDELECKGITQ